MEKLPYFLIYFVPFIFSLSVHEAAHAWMAKRRGDNTAEMLGRLTLNPLAHLDPFGTVIFPAISFFTGLPLIGWARPVPVNPRNFRNWRWDEAIVAAAGPGSNLILAVCFAILLGIMLRLGIHGGEAQQAGFMIQEPLIMMASMGVRINVILALFNLIPVPPLDGGRVFSGLFPFLHEHLMLLERYGFIVLYLLFFTGALGAIIFYPAQILTNLLLSLAV